MTRKQTSKNKTAIEPVNVDENKAVILNNSSVTRSIAVSGEMIELVGGKHSKAFVVDDFEEFSSMLQGVSPALILKHESDYIAEIKKAEKE